MSVPRNIVAKLCDFTSDGSIVIHGSDNEHLIVDLGPAQVRNLELSIARYVEYWKKKEIPA